MRFVPNLCQEGNLSVQNNEHNGHSNGLCEANALRLLYKICSVKCACALFSRKNLLVEQRKCCLLD